MGRPRKYWNIEVTEEDIEKSMVNDSYQCVLAQAIARQIPGARKIDVDLQTVRWTDENGRHVMLTPLEAAGYIVAFDAGEEIHPFRTRLANPVPSLQKKPVTSAAKKVKKAENDVTHARERKQRAERQRDTASLPEEVRLAERKIEEAEAEIKQARVSEEDIRAAYKASGEQVSPTRISEATRPAPPKVFKTKRREYGHRVLRVNQAPGRKHYAG
jgi:hypothetical protein